MLEYRCGGLQEVSYRKILTKAGQYAFVANPFFRKFGLTLVLTVKVLNLGTLPGRFDALTPMFDQNGSQGIGLMLKGSTRLCVRRISCL